MKKKPKDALDEREKAFEAKYQLDEAIAFKVGMRRAKLLGLMVAGRLGLSGEAAAAYARAAVEADLDKPGHVAMLAKLAADLSAAGLDAGGLAGAMTECEAVARAQVIAEVTGRR